MNKSYDVIIVGGGMVGATLGCALGNGPLRVAVLETRPPRPFAPTDPLDLRVAAISLASKRIIAGVGAWSGVAARRFCPYARLRVWEDEDRGVTEFHSAAIGEPALGYFLENRVLQLALWERLQESENVDLLCPAQTRRLSLHTDGAAVTLADGHTLTGRLLVGADGAQSQVRQAAGIGIEAWDYEQYAVVATAKIDLPQQDITWQRFTPTGPQAFLPLPAQHASLVWYCPPRQAQRLLELTEDSFIDAVQNAFPACLGRVQTLVGRGGFPLRRLHARRYVKPHIALIGDAAHTIHPLAGQGVNLGLLDAAVLAEVLLDAAAAGQDIGDVRVSNRYERWRRPDNFIMQTAMEAFYRVFGNSIMPLRLLRNLGLGAANQLTPAKHQVMRYAMGLAGRLPQLAREPAR